MKTALIVLMCYLHQPVALFLSNDESSVLYPFKTAPLEDKTKDFLSQQCSDPEAKSSETFRIWHLDKLNDHIWAKR